MYTYNIDIYICILICLPGPFNSTAPMIYGEHMGTFFHDNNELGIVASTSVGKVTPYVHYQFFDGSWGCELYSIYQLNYKPYRNPNP